MNHCELGVAGEKYVASELANRGVPVVIGGPADLLIYEDIPVEVKTARPSTYRRNRRRAYQFCIHRKGRKGLQGEFLILVCWNGNPESHQCFIVPRSEMNGHRKLTIPQEPVDYEGKYHRWLNQWSMLKSPTVGDGGAI